MLWSPWNASRDLLDVPRGQLGAEPVDQRDDLGTAPRSARPSPAARERARPAVPRARRLACARTSCAAVISASRVGPRADELPIERADLIDRLRLARSRPPRRTRADPGGPRTSWRRAPPRTCRRPAAVPGAAMNACTTASWNRCWAAASSAWTSATRWATWIRWTVNGTRAGRPRPRAPRRASRPPARPRPPALRGDLRAQGPQLRPRVVEPVGRARVRRRDAGDHRGGGQDEREHAATSPPNGHARLSTVREAG